MKRALIVTLALLLLAAFFPAAGEQEEEMLVCEGYEYCILEDGGHQHWRRSIYRV